MKGNSDEKPVVSSSRGFIGSKTEPDKIAEEITMIQTLQNKTKGLRIRGEIARIDKQELGTKKLRDICSVAEKFCGYYLGNGHQAAYGIFDYGNRYEIKYAINTVNFADGSKYRHNNCEIQDRELNCLNTVIADVTGQSISEDCRFDFDMLEYSGITD